ncbi:MAG: hypothetical protein H6559_11655 [Lewinellaceae bacterium]|nr:hypothetical protein [Lewinellaceae bacterium]
MNKVAMYFKLIFIDKHMIAFIHSIIPSFHHSLTKVSGVPSHMHKAWPMRFRQAGCRGQELFFSGRHLGNALSWKKSGILPNFAFRKKQRLPTWRNW